MKKSLSLIFGIWLVASGCSSVRTAPSEEIDAYEVATVSRNDQIVAGSKQSMSPASRAKAMEIDKSGSTYSTQRIVGTANFEKIGHSVWEFDVKNGTIETLYGRRANIDFILQPCNQTAWVQENQIGSPVLKCTDPNGAPLKYSGILSVRVGHQLNFDLGNGYRATLAITRQ